MSLYVGLGLVALLLLLQGFFSGSGMALASANRVRLKARADEGQRGAGVALRMLEHEEDRLLGTCLVGTNLSLVSGTTLFAWVLVREGIEGAWLHTLLFLPFALVLGEALPRQVYRHHADALAPRLAPALRLLQRLFSPLLLVVQGWTGLVRRAVVGEEETIRREDIVQMLDDHAGGIAPSERVMIQRLLAMTELTVEECMTPLVDVYAVPETATVGEATALVLRHGHSRLPVYRDRVDNIVGRIEHRGLLFARGEDAPIEPLVEPVKFVPESKRIDELLREMRADREPFAVVVDEYGGSVGVVTIEDLLEQIVGDIQDERDRHLPGIRRLGPREWRVPARTEIGELEEAVGVVLPDGDYETVAGLLLAATGRIPETGEIVRLGRLAFHVEAASERALHSLRVVLSAE